MQYKIDEYEYDSRHNDSTSSSSSNETVITADVDKEDIQNLRNRIEALQKEYADLEEKYQYEKHELQAIVEQLREDVIDLDKTKQLYIGKTKWNYLDS